MNDTYTAYNECLALRDVHLALFWVRIKHQVMHRPCLFEFKSIFIHKPHLPEKVRGTNLRGIKSGGRVIYAPGGYLIDDYVQHGKACEVSI